MTKKSEGISAISSSILFSVISRGVQAKISTEQIVTGTENPISIDGSLSKDLDNPEIRNSLRVILMQRNSLIAFLITSTKSRYNLIRPFQLIVRVVM